MRRPPSTATKYLLATALGLGPACGGSDVAPPASASPSPTQASVGPGAPAPPPASAAASAEPAAPPPSSAYKAMITGHLKNTPVVVVKVVEPAAAVCGVPLPKTAGARALELRVQWERGVYDAPKAAQIRFDTFTRGVWSGMPAISGQIDVRAAPTKVGESGRIHVKADRPGASFDEELDVVVCVPVEIPKAK
jgi:hypothetical protein